MQLAGPVLTKMCESDAQEVADFLSSNPAAYTADELRTILGENTHGGIIARDHDLSIVGMVVFKFFGSAVLLEAFVLAENECGLTGKNLMSGFIACLIVVGCEAVIVSVRTRNSIDDLMRSMGFKAFSFDRDRDEVIYVVDRDSVLVIEADEEE